MRLPKVTIKGLAVTSSPLLLFEKASKTVVTPHYGCS